ncbi:TadE/TadG family type IV pilus assembly protein [Catellatospora sp. KI3]|uniref:TadE/TadG family type IV pilus assembly protein n=1 Tax=Catellatospora sp. KI3 TaxID=3041620 RepID=UPI0024832E41|nr:TadE/TadG family type IV pilus assembly protein [Catellatospora sp. KI3]MDI1462100.1 TadE/TadG family type IV pilus assembly protein [Catellatospora sp. KI3]
MPGQSLVRRRRLPSWGRRGLRARRLARRDRGAAAVEMAIMALPLLVVTFLVVQAAFVYQAKALALAAATQGANAARNYGSDATAGRDRARAFLRRVGFGIADTDVTASVNADVATVTVTGKAQSIIPFWEFTVSHTAYGPVERFTR